MKPIDNAVLETIKSYLRTSKVGGMPDELADSVEAVVADAARLSYFTLGLSEHAAALLKVLEKNR